jgi:predicted ester cyclase
MTESGSTHATGPRDVRESWNKKNIVERFVSEALDRGLLDVVDETRGAFAEQSKRRILAWRTAFPDFSTSIEQLVAEGDWVAFRLKHSGTHAGEFLGVAATGRHVEFTSMVFNRVENGVVVENWGLHDNETLRNLLVTP